MLLKSELTSVKASKTPLFSVRSSQPEVCSGLPLSFCNGSELTAVNYSAVLESRFVTCNVSSNREYTLSPLPSCPPTNEIEEDIERVLEDEKLKQMGLHYSQFTILDKGLGRQRSRNF